MTVRTSVNFGFRVQVKALGFKFKGLRVRVSGFKSRINGLGFRDLMLSHHKMKFRL